MPLYRLAHWPDMIQYQHQGRAWMLERAFEGLDLSKVSNVLEVGCGDGWISYRLGERFDRVIGFDINPFRIQGRQADNVLLVAASADRIPIADQSIDLILSFAVLEHLPDREGVLKRLIRLLRPGGRMIHIVPTATMKVLQWLGFIPDRIRKELRGLTRALAGQRKEKGQKYYDGFETNNPTRPSVRRRRLARLLPRVHGEYDTNWQEFVENTHQRWIALFERTGLRVDRSTRLGMFSPYGFGLSSPARWASSLGLASVRGYILTPASQEPAHG